MNKPTNLVLFSEITIDENGFTYWGDCRVDFKTCEVAMKERGPGCVGWRDITGPLPYFEFAGEKRVIVTFPKPTWIDRLLGRDPFHAFQFKLKELGFGTFDRS